MVSLKYSRMIIVAEINRALESVSRYQSFQALSMRSSVDAGTGGEVECGRVRSARSVFREEDEMRIASSASENPPVPGGLIWLASYPKSGNTWVRLFLGSLDLGRDVDLQKVMNPRGWRFAPAFAADAWNPDGGPLAG